MSRLLEHIAVLVFRLAFVAAAGVGVAVILVVVGVTWHDASMWLLRIGLPVGGIVVLVWIIDLFRSR